MTNQSILLSNGDWVSSWNPSSRKPVDEEPFDLEGLNKFVGNQTFQVDKTLLCLNHGWIFFDFQIYWSV
jgi:hypothetical protein